MLNKYLDRLERRFGRFAIPNLMIFVIIGMALIYIFDIMVMTNPDSGIALSSLLTFDRTMIMQGQVWRIISFIFIPPSYSLLFVFFELYFLWVFGSGLEQQWGSFRFNIYYLIGVIGSIAAGFFTGYATNSYLNMSLFLAFAILYPNYEVMLFFIIPVKVKWLGWLDGILLIYMFIMGNFASRIALLVSVANLLLFFGKDFFDFFYYKVRRIYYKRFKNL